MIRVCVGHAPRHPTSVIPLPQTVKRFNPSQPTEGLRSCIHLHPLLCGSQNIKIWGKGLREGGGGALEITLPAGPLILSTPQLSPFLPSSSSERCVLGFVPVSTVFRCRGIVLLSFFNPSGVWYFWVVLTPFSCNPRALRGRSRPENVQAF